MSILIKPEKMNSSVLDRVSPSRVPDDRTNRGRRIEMRPLRREYEPLEEAFEDSEAPERGTQVRAGSARRGRTAILSR